MLPFGANYNKGSCSFVVWAPERERMSLHLVYPEEQFLVMNKDKWGYFRAELEHAAPDCRYFLRPDGKEDYPDPASFYQPEGVHGPSQVIDHEAYLWQDGLWRGIPFRELVFYEVHVGSFTREGSFDAIIPRLPELAATGINALELMPVAQFPGVRNWGYDGVYPYAVQNSYGGPEGLKKLVDACHANGIAVYLDVVYNHLGPEGNYLPHFGPYFSETYRMPWGNAINFDGDWSDGVRDYFSLNALYWFEYYHLDGLRVDAIHTMFDMGAVHFWELTYKRIREAEQRIGRDFHLVAESDTNDPKVVRPPETGGYGFTAQWLDDFHHALYVLLDEKGTELYEDFGQMEQLAKAYKEGFVHSGEYVKFRNRKHGAPSTGIAGDKFVVFNQNHDQVGNRVDGSRLSALVSFDQLKLAAAAILLAPYVPMLFMGEEYGEDNSFYYFVDHSDPELVSAVQQGRITEFEKYKWATAPPDPQEEKTLLFHASPGKSDTAEGTGSYWTGIRS